MLKRREKMKILTALFIAVIFSSNAAYAAYSCTGKIDSINQPNSGGISIMSYSLYGDPQGRTICFLTQEYKGVNTETCKGWLAKLLSFEARGKDITVQYNDSRSSCTNQPAWGAASVPWALW